MIIASENGKNKNSTVVPLWWYHFFWPKTLLTFTLSSKTTRTKRIYRRDRLILPLFWTEQSRAKTMRVSVRFNGKWFVVPCGEGKTSIQWLIEETLRRACDTHDSEKCAKDFEATLAQSGGSLHPNDSIYEVLNDSDFVHIFGK